MIEHRDFLDPFINPQPFKIEGKVKLLDWERLKKICEEHPNSTIEAGLMEDWDYTSGTVFEDGKRIEPDYIYALSRWATPICLIDYKEEIECWVYVDIDNEPDPKCPDW